MPEARTIAFEAFRLIRSKPQHGSGLIPSNMPARTDFRCAECDAKAESFRALFRLESGATCFIREVSTRARGDRI